MEAAAKTVSISNKDPRRDVEGRIVDCHDGNIVGPINGTYFLYGEWYGNSNFAVAGNSMLPKLSVYTSPDLTSGSWTFKGLLHNNILPGGPTRRCGNGRQKVPGIPPQWCTLHRTKSSSSTGQLLLQNAVRQAGALHSLLTGIHFELISLTEKGYFVNSSVDGSSL